jgi:transposase
MGAKGLEVRQDISAVVLRKKARQEKDGKVVVRLFGIAAVLDGISRGEAARQAGMNRQTLCDWIHQYNVKGLEGLRDRPKGHARRALTPEQEKKLEAIVEQTPEGTLIRWRRVDLKAIIEKEFGVTYHERSVGKVLRRMGFVRLSVRPLHPEASLEKQETFKKTSPLRSPKSFPIMQTEKRSSSGSKTKRGSDRKVR